MQKKDIKRRDTKLENEIDRHVGLRIRMRRYTLGMTQPGLARQVLVRFQQVQKYETGTNRVPASRLWLVARALGVSVEYFFEGLEDRLKPSSIRKVTELRAST